MKKTIKHMVEVTGTDEEWYLCNGVFRPNPDKLVEDWDKVTCKNCLKQKDK